MIWPSLAMLSYSWMAARRYVSSPGLTAAGSRPKVPWGRGNIGWTREVDLLCRQGRGPPSEVFSLATGCYSGSHGFGWDCSTDPRSHSGSQEGHPHAQPAQPAPGSGRMDPTTQGWLCSWGWHRVGKMPSWSPASKTRPLPWTAILPSTGLHRNSTMAPVATSYPRILLEPGQYASLGQLCQGGPPPPSAPLELGPGQNFYECREVLSPLGGANTPWFSRCVGAT